MRACERAGILPLHAAVCTSAGAGGNRVITVLLALLVQEGCDALLRDWGRWRHARRLFVCGSSTRWRAKDWPTINAARQWRQ